MTLSLTFSNELQTALEVREMVELCQPTSFLNSYFSDQFNEKLNFSRKSYFSTKFCQLQNFLSLNY